MYVFTAEEANLQWSYLSFGVRSFRFFDLLRLEESFSASSSELQEWNNTSIREEFDGCKCIHRLCFNYIINNIKIQN